MDKNFSNSGNSSRQNKGIQPKKAGLDEKIQSMKIAVMDAERCREIAQKLTAYIADDKRK